MRPLALVEPAENRSVPPGESGACHEALSLAASDAVDATSPNPPSTLRLYLDLPPRHSSRGPRYTVRLGSPAGEAIITDRLTPLYDAARALLAHGIRGRFELWDGERSFPRMTGNIEELGKLRVEESEIISPGVRRWMAFPGDRERPKTADCFSGRPKTCSKPNRPLAARGCRDDQPLTSRLKSAAA